MYSPAPPDTMFDFLHDPAKPETYSPSVQPYVYTTSSLPNGYQAPPSELEVIQVQSIDGLQDLDETLWHQWVQLDWPAADRETTVVG